MPFTLPLDQAPPKAADAARALHEMEDAANAAHAELDRLELGHHDAEQRDTPDAAAAILRGEKLPSAEHARRNEEAIIEARRNALAHDLAVDERKKQLALAISVSLDGWSQTADQKVE